MFDSNKLNIGAYYLASYASTETHVRDLAACGIDVMMNMRHDRAALDLLARYGVGAVVSGIVPGWFGGDGSNAGTMEEKNLFVMYEEAAAGFQDHPAIWGIDAGDEPSSLDFPHYGKVIKAIQKGFPGKIPYLNIYPSYGVKGTNTAEEIIAQLGTSSYSAYIDRYVKHVNTPYICFDYYLYSASLSGMFESMETVSRACRENIRDMWMVLQVNSQNPKIFVSEKQLRFQANCALAFGATTIIWACYCAGWWHNHVLDRQGNQTEQYEKLKRVNAWLHEMGRTYMQYARVDTHYLGAFLAQELAECCKPPVSRLKAGCFYDMHAERARMLVGQMEKRSGEGEALFVCSADDPTGESPAGTSIHFACERPVRMIDPDGVNRLIAHGEGRYTVELESCEGILLVAE